MIQNMPGVQRAEKSFLAALVSAFAWREHH